MATRPRAEDDPAAFVVAYLRAMEERALDRARAMLAPGARITFPGGVRLADVEAIAAASARRYRRVLKAIERCDVCADADGWIVHCHGTLYGQWADGTAFAGLRFIDRFEIRDGRILRQDVWNDAAHARAPA